MVDTSKNITINYSRGKIILMAILMLLVECLLLFVVMTWLSPSSTDSPNWLEISVFSIFILLLPYGIMRLLKLCKPNLWALKIGPQGFQLREQALIPWDAVESIRILHIRMSRIIGLYLDPEKSHRFKFAGMPTKSVTLSSKLLEIEEKEMLQIFDAYIKIYGTKKS